MDLEVPHPSAPPPPRSRWALAALGLGVGSLLFPLLAPLTLVAYVVAEREMAAGRAARSQLAFLGLMLSLLPWVKAAVAVLALLAQRAGR